MKEIQPEWEVSELVGVWWRPAFDALMYPYIPPHITKPKESRNARALPPLPLARARAAPSHSLVAGGWWVGRRQAKCTLCCCQRNVRFPCAE